MRYVVGIAQDIYNGTATAKWVFKFQFASGGGLEFQK